MTTGCRRWRAITAPPAARITPTASSPPSTVTGHRVSPAGVQPPATGVSPAGRVPPPPPGPWKRRRGAGQPRGARLDQRDVRLVVGALRDEQAEEADAARLVL